MSTLQGKSRLGVFTFGDTGALGYSSDRTFLFARALPAEPTIAYADLSFHKSLSKLIPSQEH